MALQIWLPLNGNINNQGLANITTSASGLTSVGGKLGSGYRFDNGSQSGAGISINSNLLDILGSKNSIAVWIKPYGNHVHYNGTILSSGNWNGDCWAFGVSQDNTQVDLFGDRYNTFINCSVPVNTWTHLACINDGTTAYLYKNGEYVGSSAASSISKSDATNTYVGRETYASGYFGFNGAIQDLRVYDHCLSPKEVKEISKGLVLHYPMNNCSIDANNLLNNANLYREGTPYKCTTTSTDGYFHTNMYYNNDSLGGQTVTFSVSTNKQIAPSHGGSSSTHDKVGLWLYLKKTAYSSPDGSYDTPINLNSSNNNFKSLGNNRYSWTYTIPSGYKGLMIRTNLYSNNGSSVTADFWDFQLEFGSNASPFNPDKWTSTTVYDCSGFGYNGTVTSTTAPISDSNSPRYSSCFNFDTTGKYIICPAIDFSGMTGSYSFSWWGKTPSWDVGLMYWGFVNGNRLNYYSGYYWNTGDGSDNPFYSSGTTVITRPSTNAWHHYIITGDGSKTRLYVDGNLYGTAKTNKNITGTQIYIHGWDSSASYKNAGDRMSDFRIYATPLSAEDVKELYNTSTVICDNGTVMAYSLEE